MQGVGSNPALVTVKHIDEEGNGKPPHSSLPCKKLDALSLVSAFCYAPSRVCDAVF